MLNTPNKQRAAGAGAAAVVLTASFLTLWEGFAPVATHERVDPPGVITWCFGRTNYDDPTVAAGTRFSKDQCEKLLEADIPKYAAPIAKCVKGFGDMPPHRQAALISASYNLGGQRVCKSSIVAKLNAGDVKGGCDALMLYTRANGVVLKGLVNRRTAERAFCLRED